MAVLRGVTATLRRPRNVRPVVLACAEGDYHTLPLHALAAALAEEQVGVRLLGVGMPASALVAAVRRSGPAVVFIYARHGRARRQVLDLLPAQRPRPAAGGRRPGLAATGRCPPRTCRRGSSLDEAVQRVAGGPSTPRAASGIRSRGSSGSPVLLTTSSCRPVPWGTAAGASRAGEGRKGQPWPRCSSATTPRWCGRPCTACSSPCPGVTRVVDAASGEEALARWPVERPRSCSWTSGCPASAASRPPGGCCRGIPRRSSSW